MRHIEKVLKAAKAASELTGDIYSTYTVEYEGLLGYTVQIRWSRLAPSGGGLENMGLNLVISEARAGSDPCIHQYVLGVMGENLDGLKE